ncbi:hypothetical protein HYT23_02365 [Candidatus Pacearchaeota archaeon]|nr:hypothetical protein [Candidatus Pacearchaeota archaeon]
MAEDDLVTYQGKTKSRFMTIVYWGVLVIAIFGLIFIADGIFGKGKLTGNVIGSINEATSKLECKQQSYETTEQYTESLPFTEKQCKEIPLKYLEEWQNNPRQCINEICDQHEQYCVDKNWLGNCIQFAERCTHYACTKYEQKCDLKIENIDDEPGVWKVEGYIWDDDFNRLGELVKEVQVYVQPTKSNIATWSFVYNAGESKGCSKRIIGVPQKRICENVIVYKNIEKTRAVTKMADVCIKLNVGQSPNYNENWLDYSEIYAKDGRQISVEEVVTENGFEQGTNIFYVDS